MTPTPEDKYDDLVVSLIRELNTKLDSGFRDMGSRFEVINTRVTDIEIKQISFEERIKGTWKGAVGVASAVGTVLGMLGGWLISLIKG